MNHKDLEENSKPMGIGQIKRSITSFPMGSYWEGLIKNSKHVTFRTAMFKGPINTNRKGYGSEGRTVWTITPLAVIPTGKKLLVAVRSFKVNPNGSRQGKSDEFKGEVSVELGSYVDVVRQIAHNMGIPVKHTHIEYV